MTSKLQTGMVEGGAATLVDLGVLRDLLVGMEADFPFNPGLPWLEMYGQTLDAADYPKLAAKFGVSSGSFTVPDHRGRVSAGFDAMGGEAAGRIALALGVAGGAQAHTLTLGQLPVHDHGGATGAGGKHGHASRVSALDDTGNSLRSDNTGGFMLRSASAATYPAHNSTPSNTAGDQIGEAPDHTHPVTAAGSGLSHNNLQPTIVTYHCILAF